MKKKINKIIFCLFIITNTVIIFSCAAEKKDSVNAAAAGNKVERKITGSEGGEQKPAASDVQSVQSVISEPEGRDFLLYGESAEAPVFPEDFKIGPLQGTVEVDETVLDIMETAGRFLFSLVNEEPEYSLIVNDRRDFVQKNVEYGLETAVPTGYRIGLVNTEADPVRARIRLEGPQGSAEGMMYFKNQGGWKIFDFHIDISDLNNEEEPSGDTWYPSETLM